MPAKNKTSTKTDAGKPPARSKPGKSATKNETIGQPTPDPPGPTAASPKAFTVRVRMYRHGLGDCFLLTFPRKEQDPFHMLIDFGALNRDSKHMLKFAEEIEQATRTASGRSRLDLIVATHEHKDHLSGFN
jgi:glyoxylase-like metal-dependent hydrolase (beta-lactamase superfamily II)